jgi:PAS domain-containing protein
VRRLEASEQSYRDLYQNISEGVFRSTLDGRMLSAYRVSRPAERYQTEEQLLRAVNDIGSEWYVDPNRRAEIHAKLIESGSVSKFVSEIYRHGTRERIWIEENHPPRLRQERRAAITMARSAEVTTSLKGGLNCRTLRKSRRHS